MAPSHPGNATLGSYCGRLAEMQATKPVPLRAKSRDRALAFPGRLPRGCGRTSCISGRWANPQAGLALPVEVVKLREKRPQYTKTPQIWGTSTWGRCGSTPAMGDTNNTFSLLKNYFNAASILRRTGQPAGKLSEPVRTGLSAREKTQPI